MGGEERGRAGGAEQEPGENQLAGSLAAPQYMRCPPTLPPNCELVVMEGDPQSNKMFSMRFRVGAGFKMPPHHHPEPERVTVIAGDVGVGFGGRFGRFGHTSESEPTE